ncbi:hypothetical protein PTE30175_00872 [Pandoraea terrae]|uniref:Uncharacterized protein TP-0789 domain-containing protein n=1 Tax=Pandoraea terrae TaxID=1537710 RepID=A0A5E4SMW0_9BURK|nr:outer membrane lipoprotein-sorting protein [Pandoraea terrae]VVD77186.1 hypothetical protein PTE30175_00872 [Pandoraea terrae]
MNRVHFLAWSLAALGASVTMAATAAPAGGLSAAQVIDKNVAARGGLQAWRGVDTLVMSGQLDAGGKKDVKLPFVMTMKRPHKSRFELRFEGQTALQVYDGQQGWKVRPYLGRDEVTPYTPAEAQSAAASAELDGPLVDYARKGTKVALEGTESVEGHRAYKLKLTMKDGTERRLWIDATSFLELKIDGEARKLDGRPHKVAIYYRNYKPEHGLSVPHVLETVVEGVKPARRMTIDRVAVNQPIDDAAFAKPALASAKAAAH